MNTVRTKRRTVLYCSLLIALLWSSWVSHGSAGDVVVIVNKDNPITAMDAVQVSNLYLGKARSFPSGGSAHVLDQPRESSLRERFFRSINGMPLNQVNTFWARLAVSGQVLPPETQPDSLAVLKAVQEDKKAIGYLDATVLESSVVPVLRLHD